MPTDLNEFLEHQGVKGMKWGVRKTDSSSSSSPTRRPISVETKGQLKYVGKELSFGSIAPAAMLMGLGPPLSVALGISIGVLRSPPVSNAIKKTAAAQRDLIKEFGDTKMSVIRESTESQKQLKTAAAGLGGAGAVAAATAAALQNAG